MKTVFVCVISVPRPDHKIELLKVIIKKHKNKNFDLPTVLKMLFLGHVLLLNVSTYS